MHVCVSLCVSSSVHGVSLARGWLDCFLFAASAFDLFEFSFTSIFEVGLINVVYLLCVCFFLSFDLHGLITCV